MANQEHLDILKQGANKWNAWRTQRPDVIPDFGEVDLSGANLSHADLSYAYLNRTNLAYANLRGANLNYANLKEADLRDADLSYAQLMNTHLVDAQLSCANLGSANLRNANLSWVNLHRVDLSKSNLNRTNLYRTDLSRAKLNEATVFYANMAFTIVADVDLSTTCGLDTIEHRGPSTIGLDTIYRSQGQIPESFLRKAGVPETFLSNMRALVESMSPIDFYSCFISYASRDQIFAERLYADLQSKGVRCWFAPEHMKTGDKIRDQIDKSIRIYDKLLLVLSKHSVTSTWVEHEVEVALDKERLARERHTPQTVLFPIKLDDTIVAIESSWPAKVRRERHIGDFTQWKDHDAYQQTFERLLRDLKAEHKPKD